MEFIESKKRRDYLFQGKNCLVQFQSGAPMNAPAMNTTTRPKTVPKKPSTVANMIISLSS